MTTRTVMPAVSVIIPVYKVEKYLSRCLDSIACQTFRDWEAVCVDDGSPDGCPAILDAYARKDPRFKVIHCSNAGVSEARNRALPLVKGKYCMMVDSDDFIHPQLMEIAFTLAEKTGADMVAYTYNHLFHTMAKVRNFLHIPEARKVRFRKYDISAVRCKVTDSIFDYATENSHPRGPEKRWAVKHCQPWRCLLRTSVVKDIRFIPGIIFEDVPWWGEVLLNTRRACITRLPLYYYRPNMTSYLHASSCSYQVESLEKAIRASEELFSARADESTREKWESSFLRYFRRIIEKKKAEYE